MNKCQYKNLITTGSCGEGLMCTKWV